MRINIIGDSITARSTRDMLWKSGFALVSSDADNPDYQIWVDEDPSATYIVIDGIQSSRKGLEEYVSDMISELTDTRIVLARAGGIRNERHLRVIATGSPADQRAVECGILRGVHFAIRGRGPEDLGRSRSLESKKKRWWWPL